MDLEKEKTVDDERKLMIYNKSDPSFREMYSGICRFAARYSKEHRSLYVELVNDALDVWIEVKNKCCNNYILKLCKDRMWASYISKKYNNAEYNIGHNARHDDYYIYNDINWNCRKDLVKLNKTCKIHDEELKTNNKIDCKKCGFKRWWR